MRETPLPRPPFDRQCAEVLARLPEFPPLTVESLEAIRRPPPGFAPPTDADLARGGSFDVSRRTVPGPAGAPDVELVVCRPVTVSSPRPVVYHAHGGGMFSGSPHLALPGVLDWAQALELVVVSVDYRLAPETPFPGPVEDCYAGLCWTTEHAGEIGGDAERLVLAGESAGGGLTAALALLTRDRGGPVPTGLLLTAPMLDDRNDSGSVHQMAGVDTWDRTRNEFGWTALLGAARGGPDVSPYAAPARARDLAGLPPSYLDVGSAETFRDEVVEFAVRIWRAGGRAELHVWPGGFHGFDVLAPDAAISRDARAARLGWLHRLLTQ
jgi:acetyl esterase/lipase